VQGGGEWRFLQGRGLQVGSPCGFCSDRCVFPVSFAPLSADILFISQSKSSKSTSSSVLHQQRFTSSRPSLDTPSTRPSASLQALKVSRTRPSVLLKPALPALVRYPTSSRYPSSSLLPSAFPLLFFHALQHERRRRERSLALARYRQPSRHYQSPSLLLHFSHSRNSNASHSLPTVPSADERRKCAEREDKRLSMATGERNCNG
jgi:hypothetical protein